jgi:hypothetical protein
LINFASSPRVARPSAGLVVAAPGGLAEPQQAGRLAALLQLRLLPLCGGAEEADRCLAQLALEPQGWLLPLGLDPAADLEWGGCWAERLGAWRQPVLLLVPVRLVEQGPARAYSALLQREAVPLLGLVQLGGPWRPERRRCDGLPWLGWLPALDGAPGDANEQACEALRLQLMKRWSLSAARAAAPAHPAA